MRTYATSQVNAAQAHKLSIEQQTAAARQQLDVVHQQLRAQVQQVGQTQADVAQQEQMLRGRQIQLDCEDAALRVREARAEGHATALHGIIALLDRRQHDVNWQQQQLQQTEWAVNQELERQVWTRLQDREERVRAMRFAFSRRMQVHNVQASFEFCLAYLDCLNLQSSDWADRWVCGLVQGLMQLRGGRFPDMLGKVLGGRGHAGPTADVPLGLPGDVLAGDRPTRTRRMLVFEQGVLPADSCPHVFEPPSDDDDGPRSN